jgi:hypothetical protein
MNWGGTWTWWRSYSVNGMQLNLFILPCILTTALLYCTRIANTRESRNLSILYPSTFVEANCTGTIHQRGPRGNPTSFETVGRRRRVRHSTILYKTTTK